MAKTWSFKVTRRKDNKSYFITQFKSISINMDLDSDAYDFEVVIPNPNGLNSGVVSRFDRAYISLNGTYIFHGFVDEVVHRWNEDGNVISIKGRDNRALMIDNAKLPVNKKSVKPNTYIKERCNAYGIKFIAKATAPTYKELKVGTGQTEYAVCKQLLEDSKYTLYYLVDTVYLGTWNTASSTATYTFTTADSGKSGILVKSVEATEEVEGMYSQVRVYSTTKKGNYNLKKTKDNSYMKSKGIKRINTTKLSGESTASSLYTSRVGKEMLDGVRSATEVKIVVGGDVDKIIMPNICCILHVPDMNIKNKWFFIKTVNYQYSKDSGNTIEMTLVPTDKLCNTIYSTGTIFG